MNQENGAHGSSRSERVDVGRLFAFGTFAKLERNALVLSQALEAIGLDVLKVGEYVIAAIVRGDEAEALRVVEPFYCAGLSTHCVFLLMITGMAPKNAPEIKECYRRESNRNGSKSEQDGKETNNDDLMQAQDSTIQAKRENI